MKHPHDCTLGCQGTLNAEHELRRDLAGMVRQADHLRAENARLRGALGEATAEGVWLGDLAASLPRSGSSNSLDPRPLTGAHAPLGAYDALPA